MLVNIRSMALAASVISGFAVSECQAAKTSCTVPVVTYGASGGFGPNVIKGSDAFKLAGEPFSITLYVCESKQPGPRSGPDYSVYSGIEFTGTVNSSLITTPYTIKPTAVTFVLVDPATGDDLVQVEGNLTVFGSLIFIHASIALPPGTLTSTAIAPFAGVAIVTADSAFTYSYPSWSASTVYSAGQEIVDPSGNAQKVITAGTSGATAPVWNDTLNGDTTDGTVVWTCLGPYTATELSVVGGASGTASKESGVKTDALLRLEGAQVITEHADGSQSARPLSAAPVDLLASSDKTMLRFYASGVQEASEVHVQIAGQDVPVRYFGASGYFPGLDEVIVEVPRSLAGRGQVEVALAADGQTASPVNVHIQ
jgi:hypothetical protein